MFSSLRNIVHSYVIDDELVAERRFKLRHAFARHAVVAEPLRLGREKNELLRLRDRFALAAPNFRTATAAVDVDGVAVRLP